MDSINNICGGQDSRIEFADLAKGVCIILVVLGHCGVPTAIPGYEIVRMPLYFILSGLFFKDYGGWGNFAVRKINRILVPFIFWYLLAYVIFYILKWFVPGLLITDAEGIMDVFCNRQFFNGPIWFLLALFWCNVLFCAVSLYVRKDWLRIVIVCLLGALGWFLGNVVRVFVPCFIDVGLTAMPFFAAGYYLKRTSILFPNKYDKFNLLFAIVFWTISCILFRFTDHRLSLHYNILTGWSTYLICIISVLSILFLCKAIKRIPYITYVGHYSIVLLCTHHLIYRPMALLLSRIGDTPYNAWIVGMITIAVSSLMIPVCKKLIPWFVAQKDLIRAK